jgi:hypothetical protein
VGSRRLFLNHWSLDFNPEKEIMVSPMWVRMPHVPLIFWDEISLGDIGNKLG